MDKNGKEKGVKERNGEMRNMGGKGRNGTRDVTFDLISPSQF